MSAALVIDTHILIWIRTEPRKLRERDRSILTSSERRFISIVSLWELSTLARLGRVPAELDWFDVPDSFDLITVDPNHCRAMATLPLHHRDPFDRMLIAQARSEGLGILTRDRAMIPYGRERDGLLIPD